eukprot:RCo045605
MSMSDLQAFRSELSGVSELCESNGLSEAEFLRNRDRVTHLELFLTPIGAAGTAPLQWFPGLTSLQLTQCELAEISGLESLSCLRKLWLTENELRDVRGLQGCTSLQELFLDGNEIVSLEGLERLRLLEVLWVSENRLTSLRGLPTLAPLRVLWAGRNILTGGLASSLRECTALQDLNLAGNEVDSPSELAALGRVMPQLCALRMADPHFGTCPVAGLPHYTALPVLPLPRPPHLYSPALSSPQPPQGPCSFLRKRTFY